MAATDLTKPRILRLADRIQEDIRQRALRPGDPYLTTIETARMLGVNNGLAGRALQLLAKRRVIERRQRKGTFILDPGHQQPAPLLRRVHLLVHRNYLKTEGLLADGVVVGLQKDLPGTDVHFNFLPPWNEGEYVERLVHESLRRSGQEGFVLVRAPLEAQRLVAESGLPAVVHGTLFPSVGGVCSIDRDQYRAGRLLAEYLVEQGCRRVLLLMRERILPGDHLMMDGARDAVDAAGLRPAALGLRCLPADAADARQAILALLGGSDRPTGVLARSEPLAQAAQEAADGVGPIAGRPVLITVTDTYGKQGITPEEIGHRIGHMLARQARGEPLEESHETLPVHLHVPA
jgi:DNA-binding transcriptional regulator YhcF (GntR family)